MSQPSSSPRRFIAGARCPTCQAMDKLVIYKLEGLQYRECVSCGFAEQMHFEPLFRELDTRVNRDASDRASDMTPVRFIESPILPKTE